MIDVLAVVHELVRLRQGPAAFNALLNQSVTKSPRFNQFGVTGLQRRNAAVDDDFLFGGQFPLLDFQCVCGRDRVLFRSNSVALLCRTPCT